MARPRFKPTAELRGRVKALACLGIPEDRITTTVGLRSTKALRKYFPKELALGEAMAIARVAQVAFEMAKSGKYPSVTRFWAETVGRSLEKIAPDEGAIYRPGRQIFKSKTPPEDGEPYKIDRDGFYVTVSQIGGPSYQQLQEREANRK